MKNAIIPCLWFDHEAEEAVGFYTSLFPGSKVKRILKYQEGEDGPAGTVKHAQFSLFNQTFMVMGNAVDHEFSFNDAFSFQVFCETQEQIDDYWDLMTREGVEGQCGWLKDKYGVSWQVVPSILSELMANPEKAGRVMLAFLQMKKFDIQKLMLA